VGAGSRLSLPARLVAGFVAGFVAVLVFHQAALALLNAIGVTGATLYDVRPVPPFGVPRIVSSAFWGGVWGILFALVERRLPRGSGYWPAAFALGALLPSLVAWFVVAPLRGVPAAGGWQPARMLIGLFVNGAWGLGTAIFLRTAARLASAPR
jgi:hypothetical protein